MLVLSDMHYHACERYSGVFRSIFSSLQSALAELWRDEPGWRPHCILLAGDLASSDYAYKYFGEGCEKSEESLERCFNDIAGMIDGLRNSEALNSRVPSVVCTPGNHDKNLGNDGSANNIKRPDFESLLKDGRFREAGDYMSLYFGEYATFAARYHKKEGDVGKEQRKVHAIWEAVPSAWEGTGLAPVSGMMVFPDYKMCVCSYNSEWNYCHHSVVDASETLTSKMESKVRRLRDEGFAIVTLMHRSPYKLSWKDVYELLGDGRSLVNKIVDMSDLIICGHDHRPVRRNPDILEGETPLIQNGYMFEQKDLAKQKSDSRGLFYSVSLIQYNPQAKLLRSRDMTCEESGIGGDRMFRWVRGDSKTYFLRPITGGYSSQKIGQGYDDPVHGFSVMRVRQREDDVNAALEKRLLGECLDRKRSGCRVVAFDTAESPERILQRLTELANESSATFFYAVLYCRDKDDEMESRAEIEKMKTLKLSLEKILMEADSAKNKGDYTIYDGLRRRVYLLTVVME